MHPRVLRISMCQNVSPTTLLRHGIAGVVDVQSAMHSYNTWVHDSSHLRIDAYGFYTYEVTGPAA
jgi:hypothetical protein